MTPRENRLAILVGTLIAVFVIVGGGYLFVWVPLTDKARIAEALELENTEKDGKLRQILKDMPRLQTSIKRSLPADADVAKQEYDAAINRILRDAKVPTNAFSVKPKVMDGKAAPELVVGSKKPAYNRIALEITMKKVDFATVIDVLSRYYKLNLLQQITKFTMKKGDDASTARRGSGIADKPDLEVTFITEAIILDGAEARRSLLPVSPGMGAIGGGAGLQTVLNSPIQARGLTPLQLARVLASNDRDYSLVLVKDFFHGPPPTPEVVRAPEPKEDTSPFIRMTGFGRNSDGSGTAVIEDIASKQEYVIDLHWVKDKLTPEVVKYYYSVKGLKKSYAPEPDLDISESTSGTAKKFRVVGFDGDGLVLALLEGAEVAPKPPQSGSGRPTPTSLPKTDKIEKTDADSSATTESNERVYLWKSGESLSRIVELTGEERQKAIQRATAPAPATTDTTTLTVNPMATQPIGATEK